MSGAVGARERIARRVATLLPHGDLVNLGIGLPTEVAAYLPPDAQVMLHAENGIVGMAGEAARGREDADLIDAGGRYVTVAPGASFIDSVTSFALVRTGRVRVCVLGAFEVDVRGDLANWRVPGRNAPGVGGGMELAQKVPHVIVATLHRGKDGRSKLRASCTLPLTARGAVDWIVTDLAVLKPTGDAFAVLERAAGVSVEELEAATDAPLEFTQEVAWGSTPPIRGREGSER